MTWWMRPGPSRFCAIRNPSPGSPSVFSTGTRTPRYQTSQCVDQPRPACPITGIGRTISTPGVSAGTTICDARRCGSARPGRVTAITIPNAAPSAPDENHLCPSITHSSPSRTARVRSVVGSDPDTSGSVIEKNERISPATSGAQPALLLLVRPEQVQDLGVARVGRLAAEDELRIGRAADLLVQDTRRRGSPGRCRRPPAARAAPTGPPPSPSPGASGSAPRRRRRSAALVRVDVLLHEGAVARAQVARAPRSERGRSIATPVSIAGVRLGFYMGYAPPGTNPLELVALAQEAERLGYDSAWAAEAWGTDAVTRARLARRDHDDAQGRLGDPPDPGAARPRTRR